MARKTDRVRTCVIEKGWLDVAASWLSGQRQLWEERTDRLEQFVIAQEEPAQGWAWTDPVLFAQWWIPAPTEPFVTASTTGGAP